MYDLILKDFEFKDSQVLSVYPYGSKVYGTATESSDYDFVVILSGLETGADRLDSPYNPISISTYTQDSFREQLAAHKLVALESIFCPRKLIIKETVDFTFRLDKSKLRESVSEKCSRDWNQAKKRFSDSQGWNPVTNQPYVKKVYEAKKSLFHCFRMLDFAIQIVNRGKIVNFGACNDLWEEILTDPANQWEPYKEKYQLEFNSRMTEFRKIAPK